MKNEGAIRVGLLTGGSDKPYALGLVTALEAEGLSGDFVGSDELDCPDVRQLRGVTFLNLRGDQRPDASLLRKATRITRYYARLVAFASAAEPRILTHPLEQQVRAGRPHLADDLLSVDR